MLCDWGANLFGGYGHQPTCTDPNTEVRAPPDQATCVAKPVPASCTATVGQYEACLKVVAKDLCNGSAALGSAACQPLTGCLD